MNLATALVYGKQSLIGQNDGTRAAEVLLQFTLNVPRTYLYTHPEQALSHEQILHYQALIQQRHLGIPIAYLLGKRSFWTFDLIVSPDTLIPRPETELLVEQVLNNTNPENSYTVLDMGTGSGAIALAIASERPNWQIYACDQSIKALAIAEQNAKLLQLSTIQFIQSNWFEALGQQQFDIIVANPPYLAKDDPHLLQGDLRFEPQSALVSGQDGLEDLRLIIQQSGNHLNNLGLLIVEHGFEQGKEVGELLRLYNYEQIQSWQDLQGHTRISSGIKN